MNLLLMPLLVGLAASITSGVVGTYVVARRIVFLAGSIAHSVLGGIGLCVYLNYRYELHWLSPVYGALVAAALSALLIGWAHLSFREREDTVIAALWSTGMSIGVIFISLTPTYTLELMNFLFGNIVWVTKVDLIMLLSLGAVVLILSRIFHKRFLAICYDEKQAYLQGQPVKTLYFLLLLMIAFSIVLLIKVVGAILVIALLAIPAAISAMFIGRLSRIMMIASPLSMVFTLVGMYGAYHLNWPPGATIACLAAVVYLICLGFKRTK